MDFLLGKFRVPFNLEPKFFWKYLSLHRIEGNRLYNNSSFKIFIWSAFLAQTNWTISVVSLSERFNLIGKIFLLLNIIRDLRLNLINKKIKVKILFSSLKFV